MNGEKLKTAIVCPPGIYGPGRAWEGRKVFTYCGRIRYVKRLVM
jgi:hypothetical protein